MTDRHGELTENPANPKAHREDVIGDSIGRFGVVEAVVVDARTGFLVSGHGRTKTLRAMQQRGDEPPDGIRTDDDGNWLVPAVTGWASRSDQEASAALIALNKTTELGGWEDQSLLDLLEDLSDVDGGLVGVGFDHDAIGALQVELAGVDVDDPDTEKYTRAVDIPQYTPTADEPPPTDQLVDRTKTDTLLSAIDECEDLPDDVATFLREAAHRHSVFDYAKIAEWYAHADPDVQRLMEASALVIVDFEDAIRHGYVNLTTQLEGILDQTIEQRGWNG